MKKLLWIVVITAIAFTFSGCNWLNQSIMFKTPKDYVFDTVPDTVTEQYVMQPNDIFYFRLFANDGFKLIDITSMSQGGNTQMFNMNQNQSLFQYTVDFDGTAKLPILGRVQIADKTIRDVEIFLQEKYAYSFNDPFVQLTVMNRRVIVFPGESGQARVVGLQNNNTTLLEALALAGGLSDNGKAQHVKLIRKTDDPANPLVYHFDMSKISGIVHANMIVQTEDVIYVEPRKQLGLRFLREITPYVTLLTTFLLTIATISAVSRN